MNYWKLELVRRVRVVYCHDAEELNSKLEKSKLDGKKGIRPLVRLKRLSYSVSKFIFVFSFLARPILFSVR